MKILVVGSHILPDPNRQSQVDIWRLGRPMRELAKHTDWQIDHQATYIPGFEEHKAETEFTAAEMERAFEKLCQYDIVFSSYHPDATAYTMLKVARDRAGTQFVMDCDDDMFAINEDNPFWLKMGDEQVFWMQRMISDNDWLTTPSSFLAKRFTDRRPHRGASTVAVIPNYISDDYQHPAFDNSPNVVIGYCGGSSHYADMHESGVLSAIQKLMHEHKNVRFKSAGMVVDTYIPRGRFEFEPGKRGSKYLSDVYPNLKYDIAIGPLLDNVFNAGKSNIKWQESTRAGGVFVGSRIGPYTDLENAVLVDNSRASWYEALKDLVEHPEKRQRLLSAAQAELAADWRLENHWHDYKKLFMRVYSHKQSMENKKSSNVMAA